MKCDGNKFQKRLPCLTFIDNKNSHCFSICLRHKDGKKTSAQTKDVTKLQKNFDLTDTVSLNLEHCQRAAHINDRIGNDSRT